MVGPDMPGVCFSTDQERLCKQHSEDGKSKLILDTLHKTTKNGADILLFLVPSFLVLGTASPLDP